MLNLKNYRHPFSKTLDAKLKDTPSFNNSLTLDDKLKEL